VDDRRTNWRALRKNLFKFLASLEQLLDSLAGV